MYVKERKYTMTWNALGAANSCTTGFNGLLHSVRVFWDWNPAAKHYLRIFRGHNVTTGTTQNALLRVTGTTVSSSETWYEFFPRANVQASSVGTSELNAMYAIAGPSTLGDSGNLHLRITSSSGFAGKVATVVVSVV